MLPDLEEELCGYNPDITGMASPNRMDALVWALTKLGATFAPGVFGGGIPVPEDVRYLELRKLIESADSDEDKAELVQIAMSEGIRI